MLLFVLISGCALPTFPTFTSYGDGEVDESELAYLQNRWGGCSFCVMRIWKEDGRTTVYSRFSMPAVEAFYLAPGTYVVELEYKPYKLPNYLRKVTVRLEAERRYRVVEKSSHGSPFRKPGTRIWIEDKKTGEVVAGETW